MVLSNLVQNMGVLRCYLAHIRSCSFIVKSIPHLVAAAFVGRSVLLPLHTSWGRVLLQKLTGFQLFITAFTIACHLPLSWANSIQSIPPTSHFLKIHLNIILPSMPGSPMRSLSLMFPHQTLYTPLFSPICTTCPTHLILLDFSTQTILSEEYRSLSSSLWSFLHSLVTSSLLGPNILLTALFCNTLSLHSSLNVSDQGSHPYTTGKL